MLMTGGNLPEGRFVCHPNTCYQPMDFQDLEVALLFVTKSVQVIELKPTMSMMLLFLFYFFSLMKRKKGREREREIEFISERNVNPKGV